MIEVRQTIMGWPDGNCFQACVASIFEMPLEDVPHFLQGASQDDLWTQAQWDAVMDFARTHGRRALWVDPQTEPEFCRMLYDSQLFYVASGPSPRGDYGHAVVGQGGQLVFDPMNDSFLSGEPNLYVVFCGVDEMRDEFATT